MRSDFGSSINLLSIGFPVLCGFYRRSGKANAPLPRGMVASG
jgi:hypothetical protein